MEAVGAPAGAVVVWEMHRVCYPGLYSWEQRVNSTFEGADKNAGYVGGWRAYSYAGQR